MFSNYPRQRFEELVNKCDLPPEIADLQLKYFDEFFCSLEELKANDFKCPRCQADTVHRIGGLKGQWLKVIYDLGTI